MGNKEMVDLSNITDQIDLINRYRIFPIKSAEWGVVNGSVGKG